MKLHELISPIEEQGNPHLDMPKSAQTKSRDLTPKNTSNMTSTFTKKNALDILKHVGKVAQGKKPILTTKGGTDISVDAFGSDKSITFNKKF